MKAIFLDRDGVLNRDSEGFIRTPDEMEIMPGAPEAVARLNRAGYAAFVITNQSGIGRGIMTEEALAAVHAKLRAAMEAAGAHLTAIYHCPHRPDAGCECRKPRPGMVLQAAREYGVDLARSWFVGDKPIDIACGASAGCRTILVPTGLPSYYENPVFTAEPDYVCADMDAAARVILAAGDSAI
jgi:D-glycero-D-manno-heptose 1,7-bisphosphate phosphatase